MVTLKAKGKYVVIRQEDAAKKKGVIELPKSAQERHPRGEIVDIGPMVDRSIGLMRGKNVYFDPREAFEYPGDDGLVLLPCERVMAEVCDA